MGLILGVAVFVVAGSIAYVFVSEDNSNRKAEETKLDEAAEKTKKITKKNKPVKKDFEPVRLFYACEYKDWDMVKHMVEEENVDVSVQNYNGNTILFFACRSGDFDLVKYIVEDVKVDVHKKNRFGENVLFVACENKDDKILKYLIEEKNVDFNVINVFGENLLFNAARFGSQKNLEYLIEEKNMDAGLVNKYGKNIFDICSYETETYIRKKLNISFQKVIRNSLYKDMLSKPKEPSDDNMVYADAEK